MDNDNIIKRVKKYKQRLDPSNDIKKILHALQKLNQLEMTLDILQETEIGIAVNQLKKHDGIGSFAKEIVRKWRKLLQAPYYKQSTPSNNCSKQKSSTNNEYDPSSNWEMKTHKFLQSKKVETEREEYDPTQNWQMNMNNAVEFQNLNENLSSLSESSHKYGNSDDQEDRLDFADENGVVEGNEMPNISASDEDYPSSREDNDSSVSDDDAPNATYYPSVTSQTLYSNNRPPSDFEIHEAILDTHSKNFHSDYLPQKDVGEKNLSKSLKNHASKAVLKKTAKKPHEDLTYTNSKSSKQSSPSGSKTKSLAAKNKKRKSVDDHPAPLPKKEPKKEKKLSKFTQKEKTSTMQKISRQKSQDLSFEQFMLMDTSQVKKKKKPKISIDNRSNSKRSSNPVSKPTVQLQLPKIQPTYRPLPTNSFKPEPKKPVKKQAEMSDELAAALHTQRSSKRMQIYSGQKTSLPEMLSLYDQCMNVLLNNIDKLDVIGVPYDIIKPVLERCSVEQLYRLEDANSYLLKDSGELWKKHSMQDFRSHEPQEMESWREMYLRLYDAREEKLTRLTHSIQAKVDKAKPLEKRTKLAYLGIGEAKAPRNVLRAQMKYGTAGKKPIPYQTTSKSQESSSSAASFKKQVSEIRMSVPPGTITASMVDNVGSSSKFVNNKKQPPRKAPMMAKTLKSISKMRYRR